MSGPGAGRGAGGTLRERKKRQTRERLAHVATLLFIERGFDNVTIAEIADAVGVSKMTVTNYFPLKEDLVFDAREWVVDSLAALVRDRAAGESALAAIHRGFTESLAADGALCGYCTPEFARLVHGSERLRASERDMDDQREAALARALAEQTPARERDLTPQVAAALLAGAHRALFREMRRLIRESAPAAESRARVAAAADAAFGLLAPSLGDYCVRAA